MAVLLALPVQAQELKKAGVAQQQLMLERFSQAAAAIRTLDCSFTQVKTLRFLNDKMTSQGRMLYDAGGKLRWEYTQPYQYTFVINGDKVHIKSRQSFHSIDIRQSRLFQGIAEVMMQSVTGKGLTASSNFGCAMYTHGGEWVALLSPRRKEMKKLFKEIHLHLSASKQVVTRVEMVEPSGDTTVIVLKDVKANVQLDEKMFAVE